MTDRAQLDGRGSYLVPVIATTILVVILVVNQVLKAMPDPGTVDSVCMGLCNCGICPPSFYALPIITLVLVATSYLVTGDLQPSEEKEGRER